MSQALTRDFAPREFRSADLINSLPPLLKWPGGKRSILPSLLRFVPDSYGTYFEPFLGGGALFFALGPRRARLSDLNADLVNCYEQVRDHPGSVLWHLRRLANTKREYYRVRAWEPTGEAARAARTVYLASLSFNGIYRVNRAGAFNVPYGGRRNRALADHSQLAAVAAMLRRALIACQDFEVALRPAKRGDLVYLDPPYTVTHGQNGFLKYNASIFSWSDQRRLADQVHRLIGLGCGVIMTNASHASIRHLYRSVPKYRITRVSRMAATPHHRRPIEELIITNLDTR